MKIHEKDTDFLLSSLRGGDDDAFSELDAMFEPLQKACVQKMADRVVNASKEEMLQEARYALYRAALSYSGEQSSVSFGLYAKICINRALISRFLRKKTLPTCSLDLLSQEADFEVKEGLYEADALSALIEEESAQALLARMQKILSPFEMQVCSMKAESICAKEIALRLGRTQKSVENALARASLKLKKA
ncbi:MAG: hypothetical protein J6V82_00540 [Clostridia bacterium]|nr:hypothetical protein [Clostridia bacterium]